MAYVYRHIRLDKNEPFYIGVGSDETYYLRSKSLVGRNKIWHDIANKTDYEIEIIINGLSPQEAREKECEFIKLYGRINIGTGILSNMTDGGDGLINISDETRLKMRNSHLGEKHSDERKKKRSEISKSTIISKETREKMASKLRGRKMPQWQRDILSKAKKGKIPIHLTRKIFQYSLDGCLIKEWSSIRDAERGLNISNIHKNIYGIRSHCGGYIFKYNND